MREGPLADDNDYGVKGIKESIRRASQWRLFSICTVTTATVGTAKAEQVYMPILDARLKADRLRSTLSVFERSKFFFNLPGVLIEAIEGVRALRHNPLDEEYGCRTGSL
jgi:exocyst complex component 2